MGPTSDDHSVEVGTATVSVRGATGPIHARWTLLVDHAEVDQAAAAGDFTLLARLPDGSDVVARVHQSLMGPTEVAVEHDGAEVVRFKGFVA